MRSIINPNLLQSPKLFARIGVSLDTSIWGKFDFEKEYGDALNVALFTHSGDDAWLLNSSASFHMTPNRD